MKKTTIMWAALGLVGSVWAEGVTAPGPEGVPALLTTEKGAKVTTRAEWEQVRRPELMKLLTEQEYGVRPVERPADLAFAQVGADEEVFGGKAVKKIVKGSCSGPGGVLTFTFAAWIPKSEKKVPAFIHVSPRPAATADDPNGPRPVYLLPAEYITSRGYAALASCDYDFAPDWKDTPPVATSGVFKVFGPAEKATRAPTAWGILSAWSWGASRVLDWVETQAAIDAAHVGVVGLSRNGKTALCAGILDSRFAMAVSCCSGCGGAKLNHMVCEGSESIEAITRPALMWFCPNFKQYVGKDRSPQLPFDQHQWLALMAPRLLYVSSASEDAWAGPRGEFAAARLASPVWELYGMAGLVADEFPQPNHPRQAGNVGYHLRAGLHDITRYDWECYLDFADGKGWRAAARLKD